MPREFSAHVRGLLRAVLPHSCVLCGESSDRFAVCEACVNGLPAIPTPCPCCAAGSAEGVAPCGGCLKSPPAFDSTHALWRYAFPADRLVQQLKFGARLALAELFGEHLALRPGVPMADVVIPVPLHPRRLAERGFNQSMEIARAVCRITGVPLGYGIAERVRDTHPQADLPLPERRRNLRAAFRCAADLRGVRVLVIDDVMTTGATLRELALSLRAAGAVRVDNRIVARTVRAVPGD